MGKYTVITFSPVQEFIEKSRKLRDLYGSSFIVSYLSYFIAQAALAHNKEHEIVSPGLLKVARGTPNNIIIYGYFPPKLAERAFDEAWSKIVLTCRDWLKDQFPEDNYSWNRQWNAWKNNAWEFFWATGDSIIEAEEAQRDIKHKRAWTGINWQGESSSLSGADGIVFPDMSQNNPVKPGYGGIGDLYIAPYYKKLSYRLGEVYLENTNRLDDLPEEKKRQIIAEEGEKIISPREPLNIPELVKRLITLEVISELINNTSDLEFDDSDKFIAEAFHKTKVDQLESFREINRFKEERWTGWFLGDGDRMGKYFRSLSKEYDDQAERKKRQEVSNKLMRWGENSLRNKINDDDIGRLVYAGGDDFMGVFYRNDSPKLTGTECWEWWCKFPQIWQEHGYGTDITVSVGFVWAAPDVPQREILQQCNEAEKAAKKQGRDRIAFRILFNSGNYLEWTCPWWFLPHLAQYRDRSGQKDWTNIYQDVAILESHHSFDPQNTEIAEGLFRIYFGEENLHLIRGDNLWNCDEQAGILGELKQYLNIDNSSFDNLPFKFWLLLLERNCIAAILFLCKIPKAKLFNNWMINLAKVGFHLFRNDNK